MSRNRLIAATVAALLPVWLATPAAADWLVLRDGSRVETRGPWEVKGKLVVFTTADGQLASLRLAEVDADASREATADAARPRPEVAPAPPPPPRQAVLVLTDADVRRAPAAGDAGGGGDNGDNVEQGDGGDAPTPRPSLPPGERLVVSEWQEEPLTDGEGLRLTGTLRNRGAEAATGVRLTALLFDPEGSLLATGEAQLSTANVMPGRQVRFAIDFPGVFAMSAVRFETASVDFRTEPGEEPGTPLGEPEP